MAAKKLKVVKKTSLIPDEPVSFAQQFRTWAEENSKIVVGAALAVVLVLIVAWAVSSYSEAQARSARTEYAQVMGGWPGEDKTDPKDWEKIASDLGKFIAANSRSAPALAARLDLARAYYHMKRYDDAASTAAKSVDALRPGDDLRVLALYQLAQTYEAMGKTDEALSRWSALKDEGAPSLLREVSWHMAGLHAKKGEYAKAADLYDQAIKADGVYPGTPLLQQELDTVKAKTGAPQEAPKG
ncbi:MAG: YfgM family protein [Acidobacteriota bacterium]